jgi:chromosome segregation ATPase
VQHLNLRVIDQTKIIQCQFLVDQAHAKEKHAIEIKELKKMLQSWEVEARTTNQILGARIGELETNIQRLVGERDAALEREASTYQDMENLKSQVKKTKTALEKKKLKGSTLHYVTNFLWHSFLILSIFT